VASFFSRYECSLELGCKSYTASSAGAEASGAATLDDVLVVQRETQTVRAVEPRTGQEKWNFSVSQHNLELSSSLCHQQEQDIDLTVHEDEIFKAVVRN